MEFVSAIPILPAMDIAAALAFYESRLGFTRRFWDDEYAGLERGPVEVHLWLCTDPRIAAHTSCRIQVRDIDALYTEYQRQGVVHPNGHLAVKDWGQREFTALDASGNALVFFEPLDGSAPPA